MLPSPRWSAYFSYPLLDFIMWFLLFGLIAATAIMAVATVQRVRNLMTPVPVPAR